MEKVNNSLAKATNKKLTFSEYVRTDNIGKAIANAISNPTKKEQFITSLVATVTNNPMLSQCDSGTIVSASLQGVALNLSPSPSLGEYWLVPYKKRDGSYSAQFQIGVAGIIQLAQRTGKYLDLDAIEIREGEYIGRSADNGKPVFKFIEDDGERETKKVIGYLAYYELLNGFKHSVYFSKEKVINWADRYSKAFNKELYKKIENNEKLNADEIRATSSPWYTTFDSMAKNTVMKQCLKHAPKSIEMQQADISSYFEETTNIEKQETKEDVMQDFFSGAIDTKISPDDMTKTPATNEDDIISVKQTAQEEPTSFLNDLDDINKDYIKGGK